VRSHCSDLEIGRDLELIDGRCSRESEVTGSWRKGAPSRVSDPEIGWQADSGSCDSDLMGGWRRSGFGHQREWIHCQRAGGGSRDTNVRCGWKRDRVVYGFESGTGCLTDML
jgi:hypothetical protein